MTNITQILSEIESGDAGASERLLPLVYEELRNLAATKIANEKPGQTLQATALVHEAYLRLVGAERSDRWENQRHFFAAAAEAMRRVLIDSARKKKTAKRGGEYARRDLSKLQIAGPVREERLLELDAALSRLEGQDERSARVVKLRYFAGLTIPEVAAAIDVSPRTADNIWAYARSWLMEEMSDPETQ